jgi:hypothetical protein
MTEVIYIDVVGNSTNNAKKINLDDRPLGIAYPMDSEVNDSLLTTNTIVGSRILLA